MIWIRCRLNQLGSLGIEAATPASAGEGIDEASAHLWFGSKHLHPDAEEAGGTGKKNHGLSHCGTAWLQREQLTGTVGYQPGLHPLLDAIQGNQAAVGISDVLASLVQPHKRKGGRGMLLSASTEVGGHLNLTICAVEISGKGIVAIGQQNISQLDYADNSANATTRL
jgi:hypothetical protein